MNIEYSKYVIGCRMGNTIFLNPKLTEYPLLRKKILEHEKAHSDGFTLKDIALDSFSNNLKGVKREYYKFILKNPKTLVSFLPINRVNGTWAIDITMIIFLLFTAIIFLMVVNFL